MGVLAGSAMWGHKPTENARTATVNSLNAGKLNGIVMTDRVGACGHNLVGAQHIIFLGSLYSQSYEDQAIGVFPY